MMKTRIYMLLAAVLLTVASVQAKTETSISVEVASSLYVGSDAYVNVTLDAEINAIVTLTVTNSDNSYNKTFNVALDGSSGIFVVPNLAAGTYSVTASFAGNEQYAACTSTTNTLQVSKVTTALSLSFDETDMVSTKTIYVGDFTNFKVELQDENKQRIQVNAVATVRLTDKTTFNDVTDKIYTVGLVNGKTGGDTKEEDGDLSPRDYQEALTDLPAGTYKLKATYAEDDMYTGSTSNVVTLTVNKIATTLTVADITAITAGQDAVITVTATPTDENVAAVNTIATVTVGSTAYKVAIVNGTGTCYVPNLAEGTYNVTASIGDDKYAAATSDDAKTLTVGAGTTPMGERNSVATVTVTPTDESAAAVNTIATLTVGDATYYVPVVDGTGTFTVPQLEVGTYDVTASIGDDKYATSTSSTKQIVAGYTVSLTESGENAEPLNINGIVADLDYSRTLGAPTGDGDTKINNEPANLFTVCLPFAPITGDGVKYYTLNSVSGTTVNFTEVTTTPAAFTPYLVAVTGSGITESCNDKSFDTSHAISSTTVQTDAGDFTFTGTLTGLNNTDVLTAAGSDCIYILQHNAKWGKVVSGIVYIPPFRAFIIGPAVSANARALGSQFDHDATGIDTLRLIDADGTEQWYDLQGRRIERPTQKGVFIHNGRKEVRK